MNMKKLILSLLLMGVLPVGMYAQDDDMYFVPTKEKMAKEDAAYGMPSNTYYSGSKRNVDDYNRQSWSSVVPIDSTGNDIIDFSAVRGVYPDSTYSESSDYQYTTRLSRFDDYTPSQAYIDGFRAGRWSSPWYSSYYPWYTSSWYYWDDPWYYSSWYGWSSPWYYGYGYYRPWHYGYYGYYGGWYGRPYYYTSVRHYRATNPTHRVGRTSYESNRRFGTTTTNRTGRSSYESNRSFGSSNRSSSSSSSFGSSRSSGGGGGGFSHSSSGGGGGGRSMGGRHR
jgi:hypothetical protein